MLIAVSKQIGYKVTPCVPDALAKRAARGLYYPTDINASPRYIVFVLRVVRLRTACVAPTHFVPSISCLIWHTSDGLRAIEMPPYTVSALRTRRVLFYSRAPHAYIKDSGTKHRASTNKYT